MYKYHQQMNRSTVSQHSLANQSQSCLLLFNRSPVEPLILQNLPSPSPLKLPGLVPKSVVNSAKSTQSLTNPLTW